MGKKRASSQRDDLGKAAGTDASRAGLPSDMSGEFLMESLREIEAESGDITIGTVFDTAEQVVGIPCPALSFEYLIANTVLPMGKLVQIYGPPGVCKSGLMFEMMRWVIDVGGVAVNLEHESKFNADWAASITGWNRAKKLGNIPCDAMDVWQKRLQALLRYWQLRMDGGKGSSALSGRPIGRTIPVAFGIDSILGKLTSESAEKIASDGFAGRGHPIEALSLSRFLRGTVHLLRLYPFYLFTVNHERVSVVNGQPESSRSGGHLVNFQGSTELRVRHVKDIHYAEYDGVCVKIRCQKNSFGEGRREIVVNVLWRDRPIVFDGTTESRQVTCWDWHGATTELLLTTGKAKWSECRKLIGLGNKDSRFAYAPGLGVPKTSPVTYRRIGQLIHQNKDLMRALREILSIRPRPEFEVGKDYVKQLAALKKQMQDRSLDSEEYDVI